MVSLSRERRVCLEGRREAGQEKQRWPTRNRGRPPAPQKGRTPAHAHPLAEDGCATLKHILLPPRYMILAIAQACVLHTRWSTQPLCVTRHPNVNSWERFWCNVRSHWNLFWGPSCGSGWVYSGLGHAWIVSLNGSCKCVSFEFEQFLPF